MRISPVTILAAGTLCFATPADNTRITFDRVSENLIRQRLESVADKAADRRAELETLFREAGCDGDWLTTQPVPHSKQPNVVCTLPGDDPAAGTIIVGAHHDKVEHSMGAVDDWSGTALLPSLYQSLKGSPRRHRFVFAGFAAEEVGLHGSAEYVKQIPKDQRASIKAMINLECLGLSPPVVWGHRADPQLFAAYAAVAPGLGLTVASTNVENAGDDDAHSFIYAKIPTLTIHSLTPESLRILHTPSDQVKAIHEEDYYNAYRLASTLLAFLDTR